VDGREIAPQAETPVPLWVRLLKSQDVLFRLLTYAVGYVGTLALALLMALILIAQKHYDTDFITNTRLFVHDLNTLVHEVNPPDDAFLTDAIAAYPRSIRLYADRAEVRRQREDYRGALDDYSQILTIDPHNSLGLAGIAGVGDAASRDGDYALAIEAYTKALQSTPGLWTDVGIYRKLGDAFLVRLAYDEAIHVYTKAIEAAPNSIPAHGERGVAKMKSGDYAGASADLSQAIHMAPDAPKNINYAGWRCRLKWALTDYRGAIDDCTAYLKADPSGGLIHMVRGWAKEKLGDLKGASEDYAQAMKVQPKYAAPYFNHGLLKEQAGDYKTALDDYSQAIKLCSSEEQKNGQCAPYYFHRAKMKEKLGDREGARSDSIAAKLRAVRRWQSGWGVDTAPAGETHPRQAKKTS
jgi:tetratricopeptide (TPR) repeat protein